MNETTEATRLAQALGLLACVMAEILTERFRRIEAIAIDRLNELPSKVADPVLTKDELANRLKIDVRTLTTWMRKGWIPHVKFGHTVRFRWGMVERQMEQMEINRSFRRPISAADLRPRRWER
jgi:excisionase family DNA binding protein